MLFQLTTDYDLVSDLILQVYFFQLLNNTTVCFKLIATAFKKVMDMNKFLNK